MLLYFSKSNSDLPQEFCPLWFYCGSEGGLAAEILPREQRKSKEVVKEGRKSRKGGLVMHEGHEGLKGSIDPKSKF